MPEAPVHIGPAWWHHFAWVKQGSVAHTQAHDEAHLVYSVAYGEGQPYDRTRGAHSHYTPPLVCRSCGGHAPQELQQWRSRHCPWCGELNDWPVEQALDVQESGRV